MRQTSDILRDAKAASPSLMLLSAERKAEVLLRMADALTEESEAILRANREDLYAYAHQLGEVMADRLRLDQKRICGMAEGIRQVAALKDPVGEILDSGTLDSGLRIQRVRVPIGVIGIIYESRPNVTSDAGALCFKSGNVCVLRGGKEAFHTSFEIVRILRGVLSAEGLDPNYINIVEDTSRASATALMEAVGYVDALIPRGGKGLIRACVEQAKVPCIETGTGICHVYIDEFADLDRALSILENAKTYRPSVCNAAEVCLVHRAVSRELLPRIYSRLVTERMREGKPPVELRLHDSAVGIIDGRDATAEDFDTEFLDYVLAVKVVDSVEDAIAHISRHSTRHSDAIITESAENAERFVRAVDSAVVYVNASTRFTDGGEFGKGCEIGISTQKLHARGPMGLSELCSYKYIVYGNGQIRE